MPSKVRRSERERFPLQPIIDRLPKDSIDAAHLLGVSPLTIRRWRRGVRTSDTIGVIRADQYAIRLGEHPSTIWPEQW